MGNAAEMTCKDLVELVTEYLEETLAAGERARFERHLASCDHCRVYLDQMRLTIRALGRLPAAAIPVEAMRALQEHFRDWTRGRDSR